VYQFIICIKIVEYFPTKLVNSNSLAKDKESQWLWVVSFFD